MPLTETSPACGIIYDCGTPLGFQFPRGEKVWRMSALKAGFDFPGMVALFSDKQFRILTPTQIQEHVDDVESCTEGEVRGRLSAVLAAYRASATGSPLPYPWPKYLAHRKDWPESYRKVPIHFTDVTPWACRDPDCHANDWEAGWMWRIENGKPKPHMFIEASWADDLAAPTEAARGEHFELLDTMMHEYSEMTLCWNKVPSVFPWRTLEQGPGLALCLAGWGHRRTIERVDGFTSEPAYNVWDAKMLAAIGHRGTYKKAAA